MIPADSRPLPPRVRRPGGALRWALSCRFWAPGGLQCWSEPMAEPSVDGWSEPTADIEGVRAAGVVGDRMVVGGRGGGVGEVAAGERRTALRRGGWPGVSGPAGGAHRGGP